MMSETDTQEQQHQPEEQPRQPLWPSPGARLRQLREQQGMAQQDVADSLHLTVHYVNALETDEYDKLPGRTFVKGYMKSYGRLLGADVEKLLENFEHFTADREEHPEVEQELGTLKEKPDQHRRWMMIAGVVILLGGVLAWWVARDKASQQSTVSAPRDGASVVRQPQAPQRETPAELASTTAESLREPALAINDGPQETGLAPPATQEQPADQALATAAPAASATDQAGPADTQAAVPETDLEQAVPDPVAATQTDPQPAATDAVAPTPEDGTGQGDSALPDYQVAVRDDGARMISMQTPGNDRLVMSFSGTSWIEVDDGSGARLFNDNLYDGDELSIRGEAPFNILIGDATMVDLEFNDDAVDLMPEIRSDNSARVILEP